MTTHHDCGGGLCQRYGVLCDGCANADPNEGIDVTAWTCGRCLLDKDNDCTCGWPFSYPTQRPDVPARNADPA